MNFSRVKTILIVLFILVNAFLIANIISSQKASNEISRDMVSMAIKTLKTKGIEIDESIIPLKIKKTHAIELVNPLSDELRLADIMADQNAVFEIDSALNTVYEGKNGTLLIKDNKFTWFPTDKGKPFKDALPGSKTAEAVKKYFKNKGIIEKGLIWQGSLMSDEEGLYKILFSQTYDGLEFFDTYLWAMARKDGISAVGGNYYIIDSVKQNINTPRNAVSILLDFAKDYQNVSITKIELGYYVEKRTEYKNIPAIAAYKISLRSGEVFYYDAQTGKKLN